MTVSVSLKKSLALAIMATPLALVACGSNNDDSEADSAAASTVTSEATTSPEKKADEEESATETTPSEEAEQDEERDVQQYARRDEQNAAAAAGAAAGINEGAGSGELVNPFENGDIEVVEPAPVEGGQEANPQDREAIAGLVNGIYEQETMHGFLSYMPNHTCQRVLDQAEGGEFSLQGVPDMPMNQMPGWSETHVSDISDIRVNGDQASAVVTVQTSEGPDSATQRFQREGGGWTFCN